MGRFRRVTPDSWFTISSSRRKPGSSFKMRRIKMDPGLCRDDGKGDGRWQGPQLLCELASTPINDAE